MPNDAGAPIIVCSGNLVKLRRWCLVPQPTWVTQSQVVVPGWEKPLEPEGRVTPVLTKPMEIFLLKVWGDFPTRFWVLGQVQSALLGPEWRVRRGGM